MVFQFCSTQSSPLHLIPRVTPIKKYPRASLCHLDTWNELTRLHTIHLSSNPCLQHPGDSTVQLCLRRSCADLGLLWYEIQVCVVLVYVSCIFFFLNRVTWHLCNAESSWKNLTVNETCFEGQSGHPVERAVDISGRVPSTGLPPCNPPHLLCSHFVSEACSRASKNLYSRWGKAGERWLRFPGLPTI